MKPPRLLSMDRSFRFCILLTLGVLIPVVFMVVPLYLRHHRYAAGQLAVSSTDWRHVDQRISTVWCESETIVMNGTFNAYVLPERPTFENATRTYWTTKHFELRSEEREYWGFYLPRGSVLTVSLCARYEGAKLHLLKGKRNMRKCVRRGDDDSYGEDEEDDDDVSDDDYLTDDDLYESDTSESSSLTSSASSSSEEELHRECSGALFNQTLTPSASCESSASWQPKDLLTFTVTAADDYYYVMLTSLNNLFVNRIVARIVLRKPVYDVSRALRTCTNVTECNLSLSFASDEAVVVEVIGDPSEWIADLGYLACEPRTMLYFPFYLGVPVSILFFAFRGGSK